MKKLTTEEFIVKAKLVHKDLYDYSNVIYIKSNFKIKIVCRKHGMFYQTPNSHLDGRGCNICSNNTKITTDEFITRAKEIHGNLYNYSFTKYNGRDIKIHIICFVHGTFWQKPSNHIFLKHGCPICSNNIKLTTADFIEKANIIHNNTYDYSRVVYGKNNMEKIVIICKKHGEFKQRPINHLTGTRCPKCNISKGENRIITFLDNNRIEYIYQKSFFGCNNPMALNPKGKLKYDFYVPSKNLLIEYDGKQHFEVGSNIRGKHIVTEQELENIKYKDKIKDVYANKNGIKLLRIKYTDFDKIEEILKFEIIG